MILTACLWAVGITIMALASRGEMNELKVVVYLTGLVLIGGGFAVMMPR